MTEIRTGHSGLVGTHAVISGDAAAILLRLLGDWPGQLTRLGARHQFNLVDEAIGALLEASTSHTGTGEDTGKRQGSTTGSWITTNETAAKAGCSPRWIRILATDGRLESELVRGRRLFPPNAPHAVRAMRAPSKERTECRQ